MWRLGRTSIGNRLGPFDHKAVDPTLVLRALATFTNHTKAFAAFEFLADAPKEIAWNVLSWWDVKVPGE